MVTSNQLKRIKKSLFNLPILCLLFKKQQVLKALKSKSEIICQLYLISTQISEEGFCLALRADKPKHVYQYFGFDKKKNVEVIFSIT